MLTRTACRRKVAAQPRPPHPKTLFWPAFAALFGIAFASAGTARAADTVPDHMRVCSSTTALAFDACLASVKDEFSLATAIYLTELAPLWLRQPLISLIEMLAAIPSVILGLWGIFVMIPWLRDYPFLFLKRILGWTPLFTGPIYGPSMLAGGIIIAIMILPIITSVSREILRSVPNLQREAAYALGATRWEVTRIAVLSYARRGLFGAAILGLGRALGETMAVTMVIGNTPEIAASLFKPGYTLASVIANEFTEATTDIYLQALFEIGLVLFGVTILVNLLAQLFLKTMITTSPTRAVQ